MNVLLFGFHSLENLENTCFPTHFSHPPKALINILKPFISFTAGSRVGGSDLKPLQLWLRTSAPGNSKMMLIHLTNDRVPISRQVQHDSDSDKNE